MQICSFIIALYISNLFPNLPCNHLASSSNPGYPEPKRFIFQYTSLIFPSVTITLRVFICTTQTIDMRLCFFRWHYVNKIFQLVG